MPDPLTPNRKFSIPLRGSDAGTWDLPNNGDWSIADSILGSTLTLNLAGSGPITLTDTQQQVAILRFTGILVADVVITVTEPAYWIVDNQTSGPFVVQIFGGAGEFIATPPGSRYTIFFDGVNTRFVNMGEPGTLKKFVLPSVPRWITFCSVLPYLPCVGGTASIATYPTLAAMLGTTFGNPGGGLFSLPDLRGRDQFDLDAGAGRLTNATMTPDGNTLGAVGGLERNTLLAGNVPALAFAGTNQSWNLNQTQIVSGPGGLVPNSGSGGVLGATLLQPTVNVTPAGSVNAGSPNTPITNIPPAMITGITLIKT